MISLSIFSGSKLEVIKVSPLAAIFVMLDCLLPVSLAVEIIISRKLLLFKM